MKKIFTSIVFIFGFISASNIALAVETTEYRVVERIQINRVGKVYGFNSDGWGAASCTSAKYIVLDPNIVKHSFRRHNENTVQNGAYEEFYGLILAAKHSQSELKFQGDCDVAGNNFFVTYIFSR